MFKHDTRCWTLIVLTLAGAAAIPSSLARPDAPPAAAPGAGADQTSYSIGYDLGRETAKGLKGDGVTVNAEQVAKGFLDGLKGQPASMTSEQVDDALVALQKEVATRRHKERLASDPVYKALFDENARKSKTFHDGFAKKEGVVTLPSGVQYLVLKEGEGAPAKGAATATVNFKAVTITGREIGRGDGVELKTSTLNEGGREAMDLMRVGDRWQVAIPAARAFGETGRDPDIGPNESIVADVEILSVK